jgi:hypothetical protein
MNPKKTLFFYSTVIFLLTACASSIDRDANSKNNSGIEMPEIEVTKSELAQKLGVTGCVEFFKGDYQKASDAFLILERLVPDWEGYAEGVLRQGKSFDAQLCF